MIAFAVAGYLLFGALFGLASEENYHQKSSEGFRDVGDFIFNAAICSILWPIFFLCIACEKSK